MTTWNHLSMWLFEMKMSGYEKTWKSINMTNITWLASTWCLWTVWCVLVVWCLKFHLHIFNMWSSGGFSFSLGDTSCLAPELLEHPSDLTGCCLGSRHPAVSFLSNSKCLSPALPPLFPLWPLCIFDKLAHSKGIVKMSNFIKYRFRKRCTDVEGNGGEDEWEEYKRSVKKKKREDRVREWGKRYELSVVKDNKVWKVLPLFDVLPSGSMWQRLQQSQS